MSSPVPPEALHFAPETLAMRQLQTRYFDTADETQVLSACAALLQDLGFNIDESEKKLGFIIGSKERDAKRLSQIVGAVLIYAFLHIPQSIENTQKIRGSIVTHPHGENNDRIAVRVTIQRIVRDMEGEIVRKEGLVEPEIYREFFAMLSKALFLEAQQI